MTIIFYIDIHNIIERYINLNYNYYSGNTMTENSEYALDELFVNEEEISNELLKEILVDYVKLSAEGKIFLLPEFNALDRHNKILVVLLAKKVLKIKTGARETASPKDVIEVTGLPRGTVAPTLRGLQKEGFVTSSNGQYTIPTYAIYKIKERFTTK